MLDIALTAGPEYDIDFSSQSLQQVSSVDEVLQCISILLRTRQGEFFGDTDMGLDTDYLLGKNFNAQYAGAAVRACCLEDPRVTDVGDVTFSMGPKRILQVQIQLTIDLNGGVNTDMEVMLDA